MDIGNSLLFLPAVFVTQSFDSRGGKSAAYVDDMVETRDFMGIKLQIWMSSSSFQPKRRTPVGMRGLGNLSHTIELLPELCRFSHDDVDVYYAAYLDFTLLLTL